MDLLDRYLQAVRTYLPKGQQDDIIKELGENLREQIEDKEAELGHPVNEEELVAILKQHGLPLLVASRYRQPRYLIGPTLFPQYWLVMKIISAIVAFSYGVAAVVMLAESNPIGQVLAAVFSFAGAVLPIFAWVTIVYAVLDLCNSKFRLMENWSKEWNEKFDPRKLPAVQRTPEGLEAKPISRAKTVFELFWSVAFLLWWLRVAAIRKLALFMTLGPVGLSDKIPFQPGPAANTVFIPVIVLTLVGIAHRIVTLRYPRRVTFDAVMRLIVNAGSVPILYLLSRSNEMFALVPGISEPEKFLEPMRIFNLILHYVMMFAAAITLIECFKQVRRLIRVRRNTATAPALQ
jgi:hypothetical protein